MYVDISLQVLEGLHRLSQRGHCKDQVLTRLVTRRLRITYY
jgi:hypothetical protein